MSVRKQALAYKSGKSGISIASKTLASKECFAGSTGWDVIEIII